MSRPEPHVPRRRHSGDQANDYLRGHAAGKAAAAGLSAAQLAALRASGGMGGGPTKRGGCLAALVLITLSATATPAGALVAGLITAWS